MGDANGDGAIDGADLLTWQRNLSAPIAQPAGSAIPEPQAGLLLLVGVALGSARFPTSRLRKAASSGPSKAT